MKLVIGNSAKKMIVLSLLMLSNSVILAHAVIPHHYHNGIPFISTLSHNECENDPFHYPHNKNESAEECFFSKAYVKLGNDEQIFRTVDSNYDLLPCFLTLFSNYFTYTDENTTLPVGQKLCLPSCHTEYISKKLGLRAPPENDK